jgi:hypothetical protein
VGGFTHGWEVGGGRWERGLVKKGKKKEESEIVIKRNITEERVRLVMVVEGA